jgi:Ca2+-binding EF-hand superfamily protein
MTEVIMVQFNIAALIAAISLTPASVAAVSQGGPIPYHGGPHVRIVEMQDTDGDGFISSGEHGSWGAKVFHAMDANADGKLTRDEYLAVRMGAGFGAGCCSQSQMAAMRQRARMHKADLFKAMDDDSDGVITGAEFMRELDRGFMAQDKNPRDGRISIGEFRDWHRGW